MVAKTFFAIAVFFIMVSCVVSYVSGCFAISWFLKLMCLGDI